MNVGEDEAAGVEGEAASVPPRARGLQRSWRPVGIAAATAAVGLALWGVGIAIQDEESRRGPPAFFRMYWMLVFAWGVLVPVQSCYCISQERNALRGARSGLLRRPVRFVGAKIREAALLWVAYAAAAVPAFAYCVSLGDVGGTAAEILVFMALLTTPLVLGSVLAAIYFRSHSGRTGFQILQLVALPLVCWTLGEFARSMGPIQYIWGSAADFDAAYIRAAASFALVAATFFAVIYTGSIAGFSRPTYGRTRAFRIAAGLQIGLFAAFHLTGRTPEYNSPLEAGYRFFAYIALLATLYGVFLSGERPGLRGARARTGSLLGKAAATLLQPGPASGLLFCWTLLLSVGLATAVRAGVEYRWFWAPPPYTGTRPEEVPQFVVRMFGATAYSVLFLALGRWFADEILDLRRKWWTPFALLLFGAIALASPLLVMGGFPDSPERSPWVYFAAGNPFWTLSQPGSPGLPAIISVLTLLALGFVAVVSPGILRELDAADPEQAVERARRALLGEPAPVEAATLPDERPAPPTSEPPQAPADGKQAGG